MDCYLAMKKDAILSFAVNGWNWGSLSGEISQAQRKTNVTCSTQMWEKKLT